MAEAQTWDAAKQLKAARARSYSRLMRQTADLARALYGEKRVHVGYHAVSVYNGFAKRFKYETHSIDYTPVRFAWDLNDARTAELVIEGRGLAKEYGLALIEAVRAAKPVSETYEEGIGQAAFHVATADAETRCLAILSALAKVTPK